MTKSELIEFLSKQQPHLKADDVDLAVKTILEMMSSSLSEETVMATSMGSQPETKKNSEK